MGTIPPLRSVRNSDTPPWVTQRFFARYVHPAMHHVSLLTQADAELRECRYCGLFQRLPPLAPRQVAECPRCGYVLRRVRRELVDRALALCLAGFVLYLVAVVSPFLEFIVGGQTWATTLPALPTSLEDFGMWPLAFVVVVTTLAAPLGKLGLTAVVLLGVRSEQMPDWVPAAARLRERLSPWSMVEVFLLGVFVAYTRLAALAEVRVGVALWGLAGLMVVMVALDVLVDRDSVWELIGRHRPAAPCTPARGGLIGCDDCGQVANARPGDHCTRCAATLKLRKPDSQRRTWAFLIAAAALYIPANTLLFLTLIRLGRSYPSTILGGVEELLEAGMWPLALLVFVASICVPVLKLAGLATLLISTARGSSAWLRGRTRLYRVIDAIGRWSMIDVFMLSVLVALVQNGQIGTVLPDYGAVCFGAVVILTMLASESFDPRLMWDAAAARQAERTGAQAEPRAAAGWNPAT